MVAVNFQKPRLFEMKIGMLWFDNDPSVTLENKIARAVAYYIKKNGHAPTICYLHTSMLSDAPPSESNKHRKSEILEVRAVAWVLPNHFWIGTNNGDL